MVEKEHINVCIESNKGEIGGKPYFLPKTSCFTLYFGVKSW